MFHGDCGGASRFFYVRKPTPTERHAGANGKNTHPTVKSIELMDWLIRLVTPPGGVVGDPFGGSGTTTVTALRGGFRAVTCELEHEYVSLIVDRVRHGMREAACASTEHDQDQPCRR